MTDSPFMRRAAAMGKTRHGNASEDRIAKKLGAQKTPASGALRGAKGDMKRRLHQRTVLIEAKSTVHGSMSLEFGWLVKISHEALAKGAIPGLTVSFVNSDGSAKPHGDWVMMPRAHYEELLEDLDRGE
jgi:hypothetical protein